MMKVKIVKEVKRSDGLWRFACGDVFATEASRLFLEPESKTVEMKVSNCNKQNSNGQTTVGIKLFLQGKIKDDILIRITFSQNWYDF